MMLSYSSLPGFFIDIVAEICTTNGEINVTLGSCQPILGCSTQWPIAFVASQDLASHGARNK